jgi:hypothetical protein
MTTDTDAYREELMRLGFDVRAIEEAVRARDAGLFAVEPPSDLTERIMAVCRHLFPATPHGEEGGAMPAAPVSTGISPKPDE